MHFAILLPFVLAAATTVAAQRDPSYPACDKPGCDLSVPGDFSAGLGLGPGAVSDDPVTYVAPGLGACGINYTDATMGVCLSPGNVNSAYTNGCNRLVQVSLPETGVTTFARVVDACGTVANTTFGCNDLYLTKTTFQLLSLYNQTVLDSGRLPGNVTWRFVPESWLETLDEASDLQQHEFHADLLGIKLQMTLGGSSVSVSSSMKRTVVGKRRLSA